ncbi:hypothetical protein CLV47_110149 [Antricoccus suffuscus]|uniref:Pyridoxal phosphate homeostasis protein n=2 Tax=Antricoccus suffuscus TaxID=1629062 RepID=A0A2T0ZYI9_9ACTN|nr:hypothetical protein CLV47_110149 [Antricoccus suffuscus]
MRAGRPPEDVTLVAVTKNFPASYVTAAVASGLTNVGESKAQELAAKRIELPELDVRWHFIGRLQRNKVRSVLEHADVVQSVDRVALARAIAKAARESDRFNPSRRLQIMLQVDLDPSPPNVDKDSTSARGGVHPDQLLELAAEVAACDVLELTGVMSIAPLGYDPADCFRRLARLREQLREVYPTATEISAGMSGDFAVAIENQATLVRVGTALFGSRELPF